MTTRIQRVRVVTLEDKLAFCISRRLNLLFRCGAGVSVAANVTAAFAKAGLQWRALTANGGDFQHVLNDELIEAVFIDGFDRLPKKFRQVVLDVLRERPSRMTLWATVPVLDEDEDDFDLDIADPLHAEDFDIVVEVPTQPTRP